MVSQPRPTARNAGFAIVSLFLGYFYFAHFKAPVTDAPYVIQETLSAMKCLADGTRPCRSAGQYALLQKLLVWPFLAGGLAPFRMVGILSFFNLAACLASVIVACRSLRATGQNYRGFLFLLALAISPWAWYARTAFGEPLSLSLMLTAVVFCHDGRSAVAIAALLFGVAISKDTAAPFAALIAASAAMRGGHFRRLCPAIGLGAGAGFAACVAFNLFRFDSWINLAYISPLSIVTDLRDQLSFFAALWLSPNGGAVFFLPGIVAILITGVGGLGNVRRIGRMDRGTGGRATLPLAAGTLIVAFGGLTYGLSKWFAPLGWYGWGPRLLLPWIIPAAWVALQGLPPAVLRWRPPHGFYAGMAVLAFPQFLALFDLSLVDTIFRPDAICTGTIAVEADRAHYFDCTHHRLWPTDNWVLVRSFFHGGHPRELIAAWVATAVLLVWARHEFECSTTARSLAPTHE